MQTETTMKETTPKRLFYTIQRAISGMELEEVYKLRHKVFVEDDKKFSGEIFQGEKLKDQFDTYSGTINLLANNSENYVGTVRLTIIENKEEELPCDQYYEEYKTLRSKLKGKFSSVSMLAIKNCNTKLFYTLIKEAIKIGNDNQVDYAFFPVNYKIQSTLERLGATLEGEMKFNEHVGNYIAPMMLEIKKTAERFGIKGYYEK